MKDKVKRLIRYDEIRAWFKRYERFLVPGMLVLGVVADFVTFRAIQIKTAFLVLGVYAILASITIVFINLYDHEPEKERSTLMRYTRLVMPLIFQFTLGALLSASLIFYWFSGALSVSWPVIGLIALLMVGNETFRHIYLRPVVQLGVFYFILFSFSSLVLPYIFHSIDPLWFYVSGGASFLIVVFFLRFLAVRIPEIDRKRGRIGFTLLGIFLGMNVLYVANLIPPIPLTLREAGVYHRIDRVGGNYRLLAEETTWLDRWMPGETVRVTTGDPLYVFVAVFAPTELNTTIVHVWERYDETARRWVQEDRLAYGISGGRAEGYRGYSRKVDIKAGKWRVDVQTLRGQTIGRVRFTVEQVETRPTFIEILN